MEAIQSQPLTPAYGVGDLAPGPADDIPSIGRRDLPRFNLKWGNTQLRELIKTGRFPEPYRLSERKRLWSPRQIREFLESRAPKTGRAA